MTSNFTLNGSEYSAREIASGLQEMNSKVSQDLVATLKSEKEEGASHSEGLRAIDSVFSLPAKEWLRKRYRKVSEDLLVISKSQALMFCYQRIEKYDSSTIPLSSWIFQQYQYALLLDIRQRANQRQGEVLGLDDLLEEMKDSESRADSLRLNAADQRKFEEHFASKPEFHIVDKDVVDKIGARKAYEKLTEGERAVLFYRHVWGLKPQEMIEHGLVTGQSVGALRVYLARAMTKLHSNLEKEGFGLE